jgi:hypothetical protein
VNSWFLSSPSQPDPNTINSIDPILTNRNYELPAETASLASAIRACSGSSRHDVWQAVRASSAAPYCELIDTGGAVRVVLP